MEDNETAHVKEQLKKKLEQKLDTQIEKIADETIQKFKKENIQTPPAYQPEQIETKEILPIENKEEEIIHSTIIDRSEPSVPYGYISEKNKLKVNEDEAQKVKLIFSWYYKNKKSMEEISEKTQLSVAKIEEILTNPVYFGKIFYEGAIQKGKHHPIIDKHYCKVCNIDAEEITEKFLKSLKRD